MAEIDTQISQVTLGNRGKSINLIEKSWIFTISENVFGNLGVDLNHPSKLCAGLAPDLEVRAVDDVEMVRLDLVGQRHARLLGVVGERAIIRHRRTALRGEGLASGEAEACLYRRWMAKNCDVHS